MFALCRYEPVKGVRLSSKFIVTLENEGACAIWVCITIEYPIRSPPLKTKRNSEKRNVRRILSTILLVVPATSLRAVCVYASKTDERVVGNAKVDDQRLPSGEGMVASLPQNRPEMNGCRISSATSNQRHQELKEEKKGRKNIKVEERE